MGTKMGLRMLCPPTIMPAHGVAGMDSLRKASCCQGKRVLSRDVPTDAAQTAGSSFQYLEPSSIMRHTHICWAACCSGATRAGWTSWGYSEITSHCGQGSWCNSHFRACAGRKSCQQICSSLQSPSCQCSQTCWLASMHPDLASMCELNDGRNTILAQRISAAMTARLHWR